MLSRLLKVFIIERPLGTTFFKHIIENKFYNGRDWFLIFLNVVSFYFASYVEFSVMNSFSIIFMLMC